MSRLRKAIDAAPDTRQLSQSLQDWGNKVLGLPRQTPLRELGRILGQAYRRVDGERVCQLLAALDASRYGSEQMLDLQAWKRDFSDELDRVGTRKPFRTGHTRQTGLPLLNPV